MGKEGELWDDSSLITAFDDAMSKYKKLGGKGKKDNSVDAGKAAAAIADESHGATRHADENNNFASDAATELRETKISTPVQENHCLVSVDHGPFIDLSSTEQRQAVNDYSSSQNVEGYNQLLNQYYDLEEKRQKILHQLHQHGGYDYQCPAAGFNSSPQWGTCYTSQDCSVPTSQPFLSTAICSCCPYASHSSVALCTSCPACVLGGTCSGKTYPDSSAVLVPAKYAPLKDDDVRTAMGAAEKAISSMKLMASPRSGTDTEGILQSNLFRRNGTNRHSLQRRGGFATIVSTFLKSFIDLLRRHANAL